MEENSTSHQLAEHIVNVVKDVYLIEEPIQAVYDILEEVQINKRFRDDYKAVHEYQSEMYKKHKKRLDKCGEVYPNGIFTRDDDGNFIGLNVSIRSSVVELTEVKMKGFAKYPFTSKRYRKIIELSLSMLNDEMISKLEAYTNIRNVISNLRYRSIVLGSTITWIGAIIIDSF